MNSPPNCGKGDPCQPGCHACLSGLQPIVFKVLSCFSWSLSSSGPQASRELPQSTEGSGICNPNHQAQPEGVLVVDPIPVPQKMQHAGRARSCPSPIVATTGHLPAARVSPQPPASVSPSHLLPKLAPSTKCPARSRAPRHAKHCLSLVPFNDDWFQFIPRRSWSPFPGVLSIPTQSFPV